MRVAQGLGEQARRFDGADRFLAAYTLMARVSKRLRHDGCLPLRSSA